MALLENILLTIANGLLEGASNSKNNVNNRNDNVLIDVITQSLTLSLFPNSFSKEKYKQKQLEAKANEAHKELVRRGYHPDRIIEFAFDLMDKTISDKTLIGIIGRNIFSDLADEDATSAYALLDRRGYTEEEIDRFVQAYIEANL